MDQFPNQQPARCAIKNFAVTVNMRARKVSQGTLRMISKHVDVEDIYVTRTIEQSDESLDEIIKKRYPLVLCGGGDGTAMRIMEQMHLKILAHNRAGGDYTMPKFGLLKLGTGNGWAGLLEVPPKVEPIWAVRQFRDGELKFSSFHMIEAEGRIFHFGGFGVDAMILNDYINLKNRLKEGFMWKVSNSLAGYLLALAFKSIPKAIFTNVRAKFRAINESDEPMYRVSHARGLEQLGLRKGDTIYEGEALIAGFGTTENYGFNLKVYPHALAKPGYFQLRIGNPSVPNTLAHAVPVWRGLWEPPTMLDFMVKEVRFEFEKEAPFQLGGDPEGYRKEMTLRIADFTVDVLDFRNL